MGQTWRVYWRDHRTGEVGLEAGYSTLGGVSTLVFVCKTAAERYGEQIGAPVMPVEKKGFHVIKTENHRVAGRYYFNAFTPLDVPLGDGWTVYEHGDEELGQPMVFGFEV